MLETVEDIDLAQLRESLFDRRSRRTARELDARFGRLERGVELVISSMVVVWIIVCFHESMPLAGGLGLSGIGLLWHRFWNNGGGRGKG